MQKDWLDSLNIASLNSSSTLLAEVMEEGLRNPEAAELSSGSEWPVRSQSIILSAVIADALGRIGSEYSTENLLVCRKSWCSYGSFLFDDQRNPTIFNGTDLEFQTLLHGDYDLLSNNGSWLSYYPGDPSPNISSFPQPLDYRARWTEVSFTVHRYCYGWGVKGKVVKAAIAILIVHAVIVIAYCCRLVISGRYFDYANSVGELVALALESPPPPPPPQLHRMAGRTPTGSHRSI